MTYKKLKIGVDLDGVVYNFTDSLREFLVTKKGFNPESLPASTCWDFYSEDWGLTLEEYLTYCNEGVDAEVVFLHGKPTKDAKKVLDWFKDDGHTIHIVTHRTFGQKSATNTEAWLKREGIPYDTLTFAKDKTVVPVDVFIEDNADNYDALVAAGVDVVLLDQPWNKYATHANRIYSWNMFDNYVTTEAIKQFDTEAEVSSEKPEYETALEEATRLVYGDRQGSYGHPKHDYDRTSALWSSVLRGKLIDGENITPQEAILMMICVKVSRLVNDPSKRDSWVDVAGYAECGVRVNRREAGLE